MKTYGGASVSTSTTGSCLWLFDQQTLVGAIPFDLLHCYPYWSIWLQLFHNVFRTRPSNRTSSVLVKRKKVKRKWLVGLFALPIVAGLGYYVSLDQPNRRKVRVTLQGGVRFIRWGREHHLWIHPQFNKHALIFSVQLLHVFVQLLNAKFCRKFVKLWNWFRSYFVWQSLNILGPSTLVLWFLWTTSGHCIVSMKWDTWQNLINLFTCDQSEDRIHCRSNENKLLQDSDEWDQLAPTVHQRSASRILQGCLKNGGLYVKLGQGLVSMNHILPKEYTSTLEVLQDRVLPRGKGDVSCLCFVFYFCASGARPAVKWMCGFGSKLNSRDWRNRWSSFLWKTLGNHRMNYSRSSTTSQSLLQVLLRFTKLWPTTAKRLPWKWVFCTTEQRTHQVHQSRMKSIQIASNLRRPYFSIYLKNCFESRFRFSTLICATATQVTSEPLRFCWTLWPGCIPVLASSGSSLTWKRLWLRSWILNTKVTVANDVPENSVSSSIFMCQRSTGVKRARYFCWSHPCVQQTCRKICRMYFTWQLRCAVAFQRVLTTEFIDGCKISNVKEIKNMGLSLKDVSFLMTCGWITASVQENWNSNSCSQSEG